MNVLVSHLIIRYNDFGMLTTLIFNPSDFYTMDENMYRKKQ